MRLSVYSVLGAFVWSAPFAAALTTATNVTAANGTQQLRNCVVGALINGDANSRIVDATNDTYTDARMGEKIQFNEFPAMIAYATSAAEVGPLVSCARHAGYKAVPRTGGHHFLAWSSLNGTLVIDISHINYVNISSNLTTATVGSGIRLGALYLALDEYNTTFVGGICPTVGLGGLIASGGFDMQMRALGMSGEYILAATVVTADGSTITASPTSHSDLFWAIRGGGGGTYGIVVDFTLQLMPFPRSAMVFLSWNDASVRYDVAQRFFEWAPVQIPEFTSQVNVYQSTVSVLGWYLGGSADQLQALMQESGLLEIGTPTVYISGNCSTDNARMFGYTIFECVPDAQLDRQIMNVVPEPFSQFEQYPQYQYQNVPEDPSVPTAWPWTRFRRMSKSFYMLKDRIIAPTELKTVVDMIGALDPESNVWGEWHAWNITNDPTRDFAFAWKEQAYAHLEFSITGSTNQTTQAGYEQWMQNLESYLRPIIGSASYPGYMDDTISTSPLESYYGDNVCRLVNIKQEYDPKDFFTNPFSIPPTAPKGFTC